MVIAGNQKIRFSSNPENIIFVERVINGVCDIFNISEDLYGNILVALTEAVTNAIYHGNQGDPKKNIDISFKTSTNQVSFIIKDEGPGFDYTHLPDPTDPENIEKPNGRGVFLMRNLADKVSFEDNGATVIMDFNIPPAG